MATPLIIHFYLLHPSYCTRGWGKGGKSKKGGIKGEKLSTRVQGAPQSILLAITPFPAAVLARALAKRFFWMWGHSLGWYFGAFSPLFFLLRKAFFAAPHLCLGLGWTQLCPKPTALSLGILLPPPGALQGSHPSLFLSFSFSFAAPYPPALLCRLSHEAIICCIGIKYCELLHLLHMDRSKRSVAICLNMCTGSINADQLQEIT